MKRSRVPLWQTLSGWMGKRRVRGLEAKARRAEGRGDLSRAAELYLQMDAREDALRVMVVHADSTLDAAERLRLLTLASSLALTDQRRELRSRAALLKLELFQAKRLVLTSHELSLLGSNLLEVGRPELAAQAFGLAGDQEGETRALVEAGAIEQLEAVFDAQHARESRQHAQRQVVQRANDLFQIGQRRTSLSLVREAKHDTDAELVELERRIVETRLVSGSFELGTKAHVRRYVLGPRVGLGRGPEGIQIASPAVSREHLVFELRADGPTIVDVSSSGTTLAGHGISAPLAVTEQLNLVLGGHVEVNVLREGEFGLCVTVLGQSYYLPFDEVDFEFGAVRKAEDDWIEFVPTTNSLYLNGCRINCPVELCDGDQLGAQAAGPSLLTVRR